MKDSDIQKRRVAALKALVDKYDSKAEFARRYGLEPSYISQLLGGHRGFGEKSARNIESKVGLPEGFFDREEGAEGRAKEGAAKEWTTLDALNKLKGRVTPRSRTAIDRIERAAREGRLSEDDLVLLEGIAARFEERKSEKN
ncbi:hypothetical protein ACEK07_45985 [Alcanivoracaceae bacterium MT1]